MEKIWFIGTGFIWGNMAENFKDRWYKTVQYSLEEPYVNNKDELKEADVVFVAVPTPTKDRKFDDSILIKAMANTRAGQKIVIKSTVLAGTIEKLQQLYPDRFFFHSAEFLTERNARNDVDNPSRNVVWYTEQSKDYSNEIMSILPDSKVNIVCKSTESELGKYFANFLLTAKIIMANLMYDICQKYWVDYEVVKHIAWTDPRIWESHLWVEFEGGRWANWHCFPKDMASFHEMYWQDWLGHILLEAMEMYNKELNLKTWKQIDIIEEVYWLNKK